MKKADLKNNKPPFIVERNWKPYKQSINILDEANRNASLLGVDHLVECRLSTNIKHDSDKKELDIRETKIVISGDDSDTEYPIASSRDV